MHCLFKWLSAFRLRTTALFSRSPKSLCRSQNIKGFTLVELLVVISIIAVLSATGTAVYTNARNSALKAKRMADIDAIKKAYEKNFSPDLNGGQGGYKPLIGTDFASGSIPSPDNTNNTTYLVVGPTPGALVNNTVGSGATAFAPSFAACVNLTDGSRCAASVPNSCYCATSTQGEKLTTTSSSCDAFGVLSNGLIGRWKMDENSGTAAVDSSGNGNNGTWYGTGAHWITGKSGSAAQFNGTNDYIQVPLTSSLTLNGLTESIFVWVKHNNSDYLIFEDTWRRRLFKDQWVLIDNNSNTYHYVKVLGVNDNNWHLVGYTVKDGTINAYLDGRITASASTTQIPSNLRWWFGRVCSGASCDLYYEGLIDDLRIYNHGLNASEISLLYNSGNGCF